MNQRKELIDILLDSQEWETFECKRAVTKPLDLLEVVVAFANTDGGVLVIGMEDPKKAIGNNRLIGVGEHMDNVSEFLKMIDKEIEPPIMDWEKSEVVIVNTKRDSDILVLINVQKSGDVHSLRKGDTFVRKGSQNIKVGSSEIIRLKYEKGSVRFEDEKSDVNDLSCLDKKLFSEYKKFTASTGESDWQFLKDNGLAALTGKKFFLTKAGVLLFGKNPSVLLKSKVGIKISHYYGTEANNSGDPNFVTRPFTIEGPLISQIEKAIEYFRSVVNHSRPKLSGASFKSSFLVPEWAFQEAVTNAVIHRNYFVQDDVHIRFFDDRVEVESPGTYPGHITPRNIRSERFARNPLILRTLNRSASAPNLDIGEGVDRMFRVMKDANLYEPFYIPPTLRPNSVQVFLLNLKKVEYWDTVSKYLDEHYRITNVKARGITSIADVLKMSRLLNSWASKNLLEKVSKSKKDTYYRKPGQDIPKVLLSRATDNKK